MQKTIFDPRLARTLLICSVIAGPLYIVLGLLQILIRPGYDPTRHDLSLLSNGDLGWIQIGNFVVTGLLVIAGAIGLRMVLRGSPGGTWGPLLLNIYGLGLIAAGFFSADPMNGFPPGTPAGPPIHPSLHGTLHIFAGAIGFFGLIAACFVFARRFATQKQRGWSLFSLLTGVIFFAAFFGIAAGSQQSGEVLVFVTLAFTAAVVLAWTWLSMFSTRQINELPETSGQPNPNSSSAVGNN